jgi:hypothetical protein
MRNTQEGARKHMSHPPDRKLWSYSRLQFGYKYAALQNSLDNAIRAVNERVYYVKRRDGFVEPPQPSQTASDLFENFDRELDKYVHAVPVWTDEQFIASFTDGAKRKLYERARKTFVNRPFTKYDAYIKAFLKWEKTAYDDTKKSRAEVVARVVSPRSPRYNLVVGKYLKSLEPHLMKAIGKVFGGGLENITVTKGLNAQALGQLLHFKSTLVHDPVYVEGDASRFDQHVSAEFLRWEHKTYLKFFRHLPLSEQLTLKKYLSWQVENRCTLSSKGEGSVKYVTYGCRMSGDMNTGMGNCLIMCAMLYEYCYRHGITGYQIVNNGDDFVVIVSRKYLHLFSEDRLYEWFTNYGFTMKLEGVKHQLEEVNFCQMSPVWTPAGYVAVRNPEAVLGKDALSVNKLKNALEAGIFLTSVGKGGKAWMGNIPVVSAFYDAAIEIGQRLTVSERSQNKKEKRLQERLMKKHEYTGYNIQHMTDGYEAQGEIHPRTRQSYALAFGIEPVLQRAIEDKLRRIGRDSTSGSSMCELKLDEMRTPNAFPWK